MNSLTSTFVDVLVLGVHPKCVLSEVNWAQKKRILIAFVCIRVFMKNNANDGTVSVKTEYRV